MKKSINISKPEKYNLLSKVIIFVFLFSYVLTYSQLQNNNKINQKLKSANPCSNEYELIDNSNFKSGDLIFIIQMNGAQINQSNTNKYGEIINYNGAGQFELNEILNILPNNKVSLKYKIKDGYDFNSIIQILKVDKNKNLVVNQSPQIDSWDGNTGGVLVLYAEDTLTFNTNISYIGKGFKGGEYYSSKSDDPYNEQGYFYTKNNNRAANKGEGIVTYNYNYAAGKGNNANGGGGGNAHDAGGGGGGNLSYGGRGGFQSTYFKFTTKYQEMGLGGGINEYSKTFPLILGGGGGAGWCNSNTGTGGADGGVIVFIFAKYINGNNKTITTNGDNIDKIAEMEGCGGGGGGGSTFIYFENILSELNIVSNGGYGGSANCRGFNGVTQPWCMGPGGGGSGGTLYLNKESILIKSELFGGVSGLMIDGHDSCRGKAHGAMDGNLGKRLINPMKIFGTELIENPYFFTIKSIGNCNENEVILGIEPKNLIQNVKWSNLSSESEIKLTNPDKYSVEITDINGCIHIKDTIIIELPKNFQSDKYETFTIDNFNFNGDPQILSKGILLTENKSNEIGNLWNIKKLNLKKDFNTNFAFRVYNGYNNFMFEKSYAGADGFALIFQNHEPNPIGKNGGGIGYVGIPNSLAIELDLFGNYLNLDSIFDPNGNHLAIFSNKDKPNISNHKSNAIIAEKSDIIEIIGDSTVYYFNLDYKANEKLLTVSISKENQNFENPLILNNFDFEEFINLYNNEFAYIGISSATGTAVQTHEVLNWSICGETKLIDFLSIENVNTNVNNNLIFSDNKLFINSDEELVSVKIYDILGNIVLNISQNLLSQQQNIFNFENCANGLYFVELNSINSKNYNKFLKK